jgi:hypothetical protein
VEQFKQAIVYGRSVKHQPQRVGLAHELADEDISKFERWCSQHQGLSSNEPSSYYYQEVKLGPHEVCMFGFKVV